MSNPRSPALAIVASMLTGLGGINPLDALTLRRGRTDKVCGRCGAGYRHRGAYCKHCHEIRKSEGKVG